MAVIPKAAAGQSAGTFTRVNPSRPAPAHTDSAYNRSMEQGPSKVNPERGRRTGRIVVRGEFGPLLSAALPGCETAVLSGETHINTRVRDEAELFGVIGRLQDLGAALVSVSLEPPSPEEGT